MEYNAKSGTTVRPLVPDVHIRLQFGNRYAVHSLYPLHSLIFGECRGCISATHLQQGVLRRGPLQYRRDVC